MSYNGIGLKTARGSGTSGHIQKSQANFREKDLLGVYERRKKHEETAAKSEAKFAVSNISDRRIDQGILDHERKREIEVKCLELQDSLEEEGVGEDEIEDRVAKLRKELTNKMSSSSSSSSSMPGRKPLKAHQVHSMAAQKAEENERMKNAFNDRRFPRNRKKKNNPPRQKRDWDRAQGDNSDDEQGSSNRRRNRSREYRRRDTSERSRSPPSSRSPPPSRSRSPEPYSRSVPYAGSEQRDRSRSPGDAASADPRSRRVLRSYE